MLSYYGQIFVLVLLLLSCLRVFYIDKMEYDRFSSLIVIACVILLLCIFAWNFSFSLVITLFLFLIIFFLNRTALVAYFSGLKVLWFSKFHIVASCALIPVIVFCIALFSYFRPVKASAVHAEASRTKTVFYSGGINSGFARCKNLYSALTYNLKVSVYLPKTAQKTAGTEAGKLPLIFFVPDAQSTVQDYEPFLLAISAKGYEVRAADFYTDETAFFDFAWMNHRFFRTFFMRCRAIFFSQNVIDSDFAPDFASNILRKEYYALLELDGIKAGMNERGIYLFFDSPYAPPVTASIADFHLRITGTASAQVGPQAGFGCLEQIDPFTASFFGSRRDPSFTAVKNAVTAALAQFSHTASS
ncbi:MAG: hypothetical protein Ta2A_02480 [Treponemataceae bacterium]|nr:MAG: hypothetical protein Ta2A_02480 [Treponemataceae bacterium]